MLMQLKLAGKFEGVRGIIFGEMLDCGQPGDAQDYTLQQVVMRDVWGTCGIPIAFGLKSGHVSGGNITLPFGVRAKLYVGRRRCRAAISALRGSRRKRVRTARGSS